MKKTIRVRKKSKVTENTPMQVTMTPQQGAPGQSTMPVQPGQPVPGQMAMNVTATNPEQAIQQATMQNPGKKFDSITVAPVKSGPNTGTMNPNAPGQPINPQMEQADIERMKYPYSIVVPKLFEAVLLAAIRPARRGVPTPNLSESRGRVHLIIEDSVQMTAFLRRLRTIKSGLARTIAEGIKNSQ